MHFIKYKSAELWIFYLLSQIYYKLANASDIHVSLYLYILKIYGKNSFPSCWLLFSNLRVLVMHLCSLFIFYSQVSHLSGFHKAYLYSQLSLFTKTINRMNSVQIIGKMVIQRAYAKQEEKKMIRNQNLVQ